MNKIQYDNAGQELTQIIEIERLKLEASINSEIAIILRMADSPLIQWHFLNPDDERMKQMALAEIAGYQKSLEHSAIFWVNDKDKKFFFNDGYAYTVDTENPSNYWYSMTMNQSEKYNFNINFNPDLNVTNIWINTAVYDNRHKPLGIVGAGVNLTDFINGIYKDYNGDAELYFFNSAGEITGANNISLAANKAKITEALGQIGEKLISMTKRLKDEEIKYTWIKDNKEIAAIGFIPVLDWHITAVLPFTNTAFLHTGMTVLFSIMMTVIFAVFVFFNIFIFVILEPLNQVVRTINQTFADWDLKPQEGEHHKDEVGTFREFFHLTIIDQLTGIYNRRYLDGNLKKIIKLHSRTRGSLSVLMIDIDYFKKYNDAYGHDAGDSCLTAVASALSQCITRDDDFIARYGGEEFTVVLPNTDDKGAHLIADKMLEKMREIKIPHKASDIADYVTVSIGGTTGIINLLQHGGDYIKAADEALYESKKNGRNRYAFLKTP
ncbi:diguanylate cyclase [Treponema sp. R80B11-R83G3]